MRKKHWWILPVLAILVVLALIALDERLILRTYTVASPKLTAEVRLAVVTDFHSSDNADDVVEMLASCAPDAVLMVGDMFDDDIANRPTERMLSLMRQLSALYPCYYVSGNHEAWTGEMDALYQQTGEAGVTVLRMSSGVLTVRGQRIALCGIPDPYEMVFSGAPDTEEQLRQALEDVDSADFTVLPPRASCAARALPGRPRGVGSRARRAGADSGGTERAVRAQSGVVPEAGGRGVYSGWHDADCQPRLGCADTTAAHLQPPRGRAGALRSGRVSSTGKNHQFFEKMSCVFFNSQV